MNDYQFKIFEIICKISSVSDLSKYGATLTYGLTNYVAKYSLMNEEYFISKNAKTHIINNKWNLKPLRRGLKSKRNGFTYEHVIPSSYVSKLILKNPSEENIKFLLKSTDLVIILTHQEHNSIPLKSKMPENWRIGDNEWARYNNTKIEILDEKVKMIGAVAR